MNQSAFVVKTPLMLLPLLNLFFYIKLFKSGHQNWPYTRHISLKTVSYEAAPHSCSIEDIKPATLLKERDSSTDFLLSKIFQKNFFKTTPGD